MISGKAMKRNILCASLAAKREATTVLLCE